MAIKITMVKMIIIWKKMKNNKIIIVIIITMTADSLAEMYRIIILHTITIILHTITIILHTIIIILSETTMHLTYAKRGTIIIKSLPVHHLQEKELIAFIRATIVKEIMTQLAGW